MEPSPISSLTTSSVPKKARGFTLVEMIVVLTIISVISAVVLTGQSKFNQTLILNDTAYSIAFTARQAQTYGLSSRVYSAVQNTGYGLNFNRTTPGQYIFYADISSSGGTQAWCTVGTSTEPDFKPGNCMYTAADGLVKNNVFTRGFKITEFCGVSVGGSKTCSTASSSPLDTLDAVFLRPNTTTILTGKTGGTYTQMKCGEITLSSPTGGTKRTVRISRYGEISLDQYCL